MFEAIRDDAHEHSGIRDRQVADLVIDHDVFGDADEVVDLDREREGRHH
jgi:hypothetical protein